MTIPKPAPESQGSSPLIQDSAKKNPMEMSMNLSKMSRTLRTSEIKPGESIPQFFFPQGKAIDAVNEASTKVAIL